jgi:hypothetical protein
MENDVNKKSCKETFQGTTIRLTRSHIKKSCNEAIGNNSSSDILCKRSKSNDHDSINEKKKSQLSPSFDDLNKDNILARSQSEDHHKCDNVKEKNVRINAAELENYSSIQYRELCGDFYEDKNHSLVRIPFDASKFTVGISEYEVGRDEDESKVTDYVTDIFQRYYACEVSRIL